MQTRYPVVAGMFYPADERACRREVQACLEQVRLQMAGQPTLTGAVLGGLVPHAGWVYSGPTAAHLFAALAAQGAPETVICFGAVHHWGVERASLYGAGQWQTPLGPLEVDAELAQAALAHSEAPWVDRPAAHEDEHAIEVQLPFVRHLWPQARILPIAMPPIAEAIEVGRALAAVAKGLGRRTVALASSDLTHYGPNYGLAPAGAGAPAIAWAHENDRPLLDRACALDAQGVLLQAATRHSACGAGAIAAAITYAQTLGATQGVLLHYTTSYEVRPTGRATDLVGYGAVAFVAGP